MKQITLKVNDQDFIAIIGENAQDNWDIIDKAEQNDIWFHVKDYSSPHVILKTNGESIDKINKRLIYLSAVECKKKSRYNKENNIEIIYTEIKNVSKGDEIGSVHTKRTKTIKV